MLLCSSSSQDGRPVASHRRQENQLWISCQCDAHDHIDMPGLYEVCPRACSRWSVTEIDRLWPLVVCARRTEDNPESLSSSSSSSYDVKTPSEVGGESDHNSRVGSRCGQRLGTLSWMSPCRQWAAWLTITVLQDWDEWCHCGLIMLFLWSKDSVMHSTLTVRGHEAICCCKSGQCACVWTLTLRFFELS